MSPARWSDVLAAIVKDGGPVTPHPDAETLRRLAENTPQPRMVVAYNIPRLEPALDTGEELPAPIPARPFPDEPKPPIPFHRRLWNALIRRAA